MSTARELARRYNVTTADTLPPVPTGDDAWGSGLPPLKLTAEQLEKFRELKPCALCLVGTDGPVSVTLWNPSTGNVIKRLGHNRGVWPFRIAKTSSPSDTVTSSYNKSPVMFVGTQVRLWLDSEEHVKRLAAVAAEVMSNLAEQAMGAGLINGFIDLGPELLLPELEADLVEKARRRGWMCRNDDELVSWLERLLREKHLLEGIEGRS